MSSFSKTFGTGAYGQDEVSNAYFWDYPNAFRVVSDTGSSVRLTDILTPLDKRTYLKFSLSKIANVYATLGGDSVPVAERSSNPTGQTLFCELTTILTKTNPTISGGIIQVPIQTRVELRLPNDGDLTDDDIMELMALTAAGLCDDAGLPRITSEMLRGALVPAGI